MMRRYCTTFTRSFSRNPVLYKTIGETVKEKATVINEKVGKMTANIIDGAEEFVNQDEGTVDKKIEEGKQSMKNMKDSMKDSVKDGVKNAAQNVKENHQGYKSLQDKGSKVESEQNRPDDGV